MPEVSRFYGINTLAILGGGLPARAFGLVTEWASLHQQELRASWDRASRLQRPGRSNLFRKSSESPDNAVHRPPQLALLTPADDANV